jgi:hypothetical protein
VEGADLHAADGPAKLAEAKEKLSA